MSAKPSYDVFLSYNSRDREYVQRVADGLKARKCSPFVDQWYLTPGHDWVDALERALRASRSVAVFIGPHEMGRWQQRERAWALDRLAEQDNFPVVPVLLPGCEPPLGFMKQLMWIDLRDDPSSATQLDALAAAILGEHVDLDGRPEPRAMICPYRGLLAFREEDAEFFFGRDGYLNGNDERPGLLDIIQRQPLVAIVGASGSGKSSLVGAGLIPQLRKHGGGPVWDVVRMVPHVDPLYSLAEALVPLIEPDLSGLALEEKLGSVANDLEREQPTTPLWGLANAVLRQQPGTERLLLFVDQWEELYTNCEKPERRERFIAELLEATTRKDSPLQVILTVRGDFYGEILQDRPLLDRIQNGRLDLGPMKPDELRSAIEGPAHNVGLTFQDGLVDRILQEAGEEPGRLPLLEFALEELWKRRDRAELTHAGYEDLGREPGQKDEDEPAVKTGCLSRAIATYAESVYSELESDEQDVLPALFRKLVRAGAKADEDTRRRASFIDLDEKTQRVARRLADQRLLITAPSGVGEPSPEEQTPNVDKESDSVEVAHEELLRQWGRLKQWVNEDRQFLQWRSRLIPLLDEYARDKKSALLRGKAVKEARQYYPSREDELNDQEGAFVQASLSAERNRKRGFWGGLIAVALVAFAIVVGVRTVVQQQEAKVRVAEAVRYLPIAPPTDVREVLEALEPFSAEATGALESVYQREDSTHRKLRLAYGLCWTGAVDSGNHGVATFIIEHIPKVRTDDSAALVDALAKIPNQDSVIQSLLNSAEAATDDSTRKRYQVTAFSLGDVAPVKAICQLKENPRDRTVFIDGFSAFPGSLQRIATLLRDNNDPDLRSGLCTALGKVDLNSRGNKERRAIVEEVARLHQEAPETGVHAAAGWALRKWQVEAPTQKCNSKTEQAKWSENHDWFVNSQDMTMLKIGGGQFRMGSPKDEEGHEEDEAIQTVTVADFWISDREVSIAQFHAVRGVANSDKHKFSSHPVTDVSWFDAIDFCNKLSVSEKFDEYYDLKYDPAKDLKDGSIKSAEVSVADSDEKGYRLPTEAEWEYACRANSTTQFSYGDEPDLDKPIWLSSYAVFGDNPENCGGKMPNGWGLFDMHGNALEWCWDEDRDSYSKEAAKEPNSRVLRGGSFNNNNPQNLRAASRNRNTPDNRNNNIGFRHAKRDGKVSGTIFGVWSLLFD